MTVLDVPQRCGKRPFANPQVVQSVPGELGVVMPAYNEEATVGEIMARALARPEVGQLVVVDDGSKDHTWSIAREVAGRDARVRVLKHDRNRGKGAAIRTGIGSLITRYLIIQDADLEYDPDDYPLLLAPLVLGEAAVVYGSRFMEGARACGRPLHRIGNRWLTGVARRMTGLDLSDEATCYKAMRVSLALSLDLREDGFGFCPELTAKIARRGLRLVEVPIRYRARSVAEGKKIRLMHGWEALWCLVRYSFWCGHPAGGSRGADRSGVGSRGGCGDLG
jgi:glycosyltransferase involved in cell wall biosynthesis